MDKGEMGLGEVKVGPNPRTKTIEIGLHVYLKEFDAWFDMRFDFIKLAENVLDDLRRSQDGTAETITEIKIKTKPLKAN